MFPSWTAVLVTLICFAMPVLFDCLHELIQLSDLLVCPCQNADGK